MFPAGIRKPVFGRQIADEPEFHLHPRYRERTPFDAALLQIPTGPGQIHNRTLPQ